MTNILVVDDNQQNLYMLQVLLSANGYKVEQASNGAEAIEHAHRLAARPDHQRYPHAGDGRFFPVPRLEER